MMNMRKKDNVRIKMFADRNHGLTANCAIPAGPRPWPLIVQSRVVPRPWPKVKGIDIFCATFLSCLQPSQNNLTGQTAYQTKIIFGNILEKANERCSESVLVSGVPVTFLDEEKIGRMSEREK